MPQREDHLVGMITVMIVGYNTDGNWIVRFPFGHRWGEHGYGFVSNEYFERYNRDRWIVIIDSIKQTGKPEQSNLSDSFTTHPIASEHKANESTATTATTTTTTKKRQPRIGLI